MKNSISATIITLNEEHNLPRLLASLNFVGEIIVVDSGSRDATRRICEAHPKVKFFSESWQNHGHQKNLAAHHAHGPWIFNVDADEVVSRELEKSILRAVKNPVSAIYEVRRLTYIGTRPIRHGGWYPDFLPRLYQKGATAFDTPLLHERLQGKGPRLQGLLHHYSFGGLKDLAEKNIRYARLLAEGVSANTMVILIKMLFKPPLKFLEIYVWKHAFLEGILGVAMAVSYAHGSFMVYAFAWERSFHEFSPRR